MNWGATFAICRRVRRGVICWLSPKLLIFLVATGVAWASRPGWVEVRSPHFIVVTNASEGQARRTAYQFEMIRAVFRERSGQKQESAEQPVIILAAKDENTLKEFLPEFWVQRGAAHPAGIYLNGIDADYIALRLDVSLNQEAYVPFEPVYHEYVHYLTRHLIASLPLWMVEGLAEFYGNTRIQNKDTYVGVPSTTNLAILRAQPALPVGTLFAIEASSPYYHEENKTSIFYAESWALTHYLLVRDWKEHTERVENFIRLLKTGVNPTDAASQTIGDAKALDEALRRYISNYAFLAAKVEPQKIEESGFRMRPMTDPEALAVRADFMAHDHHYAEAQRMLEEALQADPKLGVAYDGLSFLALQQGNSANAEKWSSQGIALDPQDYRANYYYAWSLLSAGRLDEQSLAKAEASLRAVVKANPEFVPAYDALAFALEQAGGKEKLEEAYGMTVQAVSREPGNLRYRIRAVEVLERQQRAKDAVRVATLAVSMAKTAEERQTASATLATAQEFQEFSEKSQALEASRGPTANGSSGEALPKLDPLDVTVSTRVLILTNTWGVDFNNYVTQGIVPKVQQEWSLEIKKVNPAIASKKGTVIVEFAIERDGSITEVKLKQSAHEQALDDAVLRAIQGASPFSPLPVKFRGKSIALRFQCDYNPGSGGATTTASEQVSEKQEDGRKPADK